MNLRRCGEDNVRCELRIRPDRNNQLASVCAGQVAYVFNHGLAFPDFLPGALERSRECVCPSPRVNILLRLDIEVVATRVDKVYLWVC